MATLAQSDTRTYMTELIRAAGLEALAGVWLFVSAFLFHEGYSPYFINNLTAGGLAVVLAFGPFAHTWLAWLPVGIGAWVIVSPFALGFGENLAGTWNNIVTGGAILALALRTYVVRKGAQDSGIDPDTPD